MKHLKKSLQSDEIQSAYFGHEAYTLFTAAWHCHESNFLEPTAVVSVNSSSATCCHNFHQNKAWTKYRIHMQSIAFQVYHRFGSRCKEGAFLEWSLLKSVWITIHISFPLWSSIRSRNPMELWWNPSFQRATRWDWRFCQKESVPQCDFLKSCDTECWAFCYICQISLQFKSHVPWKFWYFITSDIPQPLYNRNTENASGQKITKQWTRNFYNSQSKKKSELLMKVKSLMKVLHTKPFMSLLKRACLLK